MTDKDFINTVYDILANNTVKDEDRQKVLRCIEYVDNDELEIVFKTDKGNRWALQLNLWEQ